jgi:hypothetical protein
MRRDRDLERELGELGVRMEYPPTPDLAPEVRRQLEEEGAEERTLRRRWSRLPDPVSRWAAAAVLLLVVGVPALSPATRETFSSWFVAGQTSDGGGPSGVAVESGDAAPRQSSSEEAPRLGSNRGFGERITLREARAAEDAPILLPEAMRLGAPDEIYALESPIDGGVALVYRSRPSLPPLGDSGIGLVLTERTGGLGSTYFEEARSAKGFEEVNVGGERGYWIPNGSYLTSPVVRAWHPRADVLLWERGGLALRLEADLSKREAIRIAESTR